MCIYVLSWYYLWRRRARLHCLAFIQFWTHLYADIFADKIITHVYIHEALYKYTANRRYISHKRITADQWAKGDTQCRAVLDGKGKKRKKKGVEPQRTPRLGYLSIYMYNTREGAPRYYIIYIHIHLSVSCVSVQYMPTLAAFHGKRRYLYTSSSESLEDKELLRRLLSLSLFLYCQSCTRAHYLSPLAFFSIIYYILSL